MLNQFMTSVECVDTWAMITKEDFFCLFVIVQQNIYSCDFNRFAFYWDH